MSAPEDTPWNRFVTFVVAAVIFASFGLATGAVLWIGGSDSWKELEGPAAEARALKIKEFGGVQDEIEADAATAVAILGESKAVKSEVVVPGSPTAMEQAKNPPEEAHDPTESELLGL